MIENYKYTQKEIDQLLDSMIVLVDTREQKNEHILAVFDKKAVKYKKMALPYGDYSFLIPKNEALGVMHDMTFINKIMVERKGSLVELSGNLTKDRDRFEKELALAPDNKVLMIENASYGDLLHGRYDTSYNNKAFWATIHSFWHRYNIPVVFVEKQDAAFFILGHFRYYLRGLFR